MEFTHLFRAVIHRRHRGLNTGPFDNRKGFSHIVDLKLMSLQSDALPLSYISISTPHFAQIDVYITIT